MLRTGIVAAVPVVATGSSCGTGSCCASTAGSSCFSSLMASHAAAVATLVLAGAGVPLSALIVASFCSELRDDPSHHCTAVVALLIAAPANKSLIFSSPATNAQTIAATNINCCKIEIATRARIDMRSCGSN